MAMIVFTAKRHQSHWLLRLSLAAGAILYFSYLPWVAIWNDFHKSYPTTEWPHLIVRPWFHAVLAAAALFALTWGSWPVWRLRYRLFFPWRMLLGEEVWVDRNTAIKLIRTSEWARLRAPSVSVIDAIVSASMGRGALGVPDKNAIKFDHFIKMALQGFEDLNPRYVKISDVSKLYLEEKIIDYTNRALDADVLKQFGDLPKFSV